MHGKFLKHSSSNAWIMFPCLYQEYPISQLYKRTDTSSNLEIICRYIGFADDIDLIASSNTEMQELTNILVERTAVHGMILNKVRSKVMVNGTSNTSTNFTMGG